MERKGFIGGSDIPVILGLSPYKTPLMLWMEKLGKVEPADLTNNEAVEWGIALEDLVAKKFTKVTGKEVRRAPKIYTNGDCTWMCCQVDRLVTGTDELLECKTASLRKESAWEGDEIPADYIAQVQWQLMITGRKVGWIACLIGGQKFVYKKIEADKEFFDIMIDKASKFWAMVQTNTPPMAMLGDDDALLALHPTDNNCIQLLQEFETAVARRQELATQIKQMEEEKETIEVQLKEACGDFLGFKTEKYQVIWKPTKTTRLDVEKVKAAGIFEHYCTTTETRSLNIRLNKEKKQ